MTDVVLILTTVPNKESAERIARTLVEERLAACVSVVPGLTSFYWWKGDLIAEQEIQLIIKATEFTIAKIESRLKELHPYELPEMVVLPVTSGSNAYLSWVRSETEQAVFRK